MEEISSKLASNALDIDTTDVKNCFLCKGQNNSRGVENKELNQRCSRLELEKLKSILLEMMMDHHRKNRVDMNFSTDDVMASSKNCIEQISSANRICDNCNNLIMDYHSVLLKLEEIRKFLYPWLYLLLQKFKTKASVDMTKIVGKNYSMCEKQKGTSNGENEMPSKAARKGLNKKVAIKTGKSKIQTSEDITQKVPIPENKSEVIVKGNSAGVEKLDNSENFSMLTNLSKQVDQNSKTDTNSIIENKPIIICSLCKKIFTNKRNLRNHMKVFHCPDDASFNDCFKYKCDVCEKRFYKKDNLESHCLKHSSLKAFKCPVEGCDSQFKRLKALKVHQNKQHKTSSSTGDRHLCSFCGKCFETQSGLKSHVGKHTGVAYVKRKHSCVICSKSFRCKADLDTHSVVHTKEKPFSCHLCHLSFTQRASLKDHLNVHENKYQCSLCQKSFGRERYLFQHKTSCSKSQHTKQSPSEVKRTTTELKTYDSSQNMKIEKCLESNVNIKSMQELDPSIAKRDDHYGVEHQHAQISHLQEINLVEQSRRLQDDTRQNTSSTLQTQILTINHDGNTHQIEVPVSSLVKGQFIDVSEMGLVIANQPLNTASSTKKGDESLDLSTLQYLRIVSTNEGQNTVALQPVIIPQNWNSALETSHASQIQTAKMDIRHQE